MLKIHFKFTDEDRENVRALVAVAKLLLRGSRYHEAKQPKDGVYNAYFTTPKH